MVKLANGREFDSTKYDERYKYNIYVCEKEHQILSVDIDHGVTPMFVTCRIMEGIRWCGARATSSMYPKPPVPDHLFL